MRFFLISVFLFSLATFLMTGCSGSSNPVNPVDPQERSNTYLPDCYCGDATIVPLIAGQNENIGRVIVTNDQDYLYVEFEVDDPWVLLETHISVSLTVAGIPHTKTGNPKVGQFAYDIESFIPLPTACGSEVVIAAHAAVKKLGPNGEVLDSQTAWGEGLEFPGNSWAMYFMHTIQCCKVLTLPSGSISATLYHPGPVSYWQTVLSNVPAGYTVTNGTYVGWCVEQDHWLYSGIQYSGHLYSSYDPNMPPYAMDPDWDMVNYIINHKNPSATLWDIQAAIWYFIDGGIYPSDPDAVAMVEDALANGEGYQPPLCGWTAVIFDPIENTLGLRSQLTIIEVDP